MLLSTRPTWPHCLSRSFPILLFVAAVVTVAPQLLLAAEHQVIDRVVAMIDDDIITERELMAQAQPHLEPLAGMPHGREREQATRRALRHALDAEIDERLMTREVERMRERLGVTDRDIDYAAQEVMRLNHLNEKQLEAALFGQGLTMKSYRDKLKAQLERTRLMQFRVQGKVQVKDAEVARRCEAQQSSAKTHVQVCARHILLKISGEAKAGEVNALMQQADKLVARIRAGEDFVALARRYSEDQAAIDGHLGCFGRGEMVEEFEQAAFALEEGKTSAPVRTPFGLHIIQVQKRQVKEGSRCDDAEVLEGVRNELAQEQMTRHMASYLSELRAKALVEVRL